MTQEMVIAEIIKGKRFRKELGDLESLKNSIKELGLMHPIVVRPDKQLVAGERRLEACRELGWEKILVRIIDIEKISRGEHDENVCRKDFTWTEAVAIKREIEPEEKAAAKVRQGTRTDLDQHGGNLPLSSTGKSRDKAAKATGKKARTLAKAEAVVAAAEADPENQELKHIVEEMDESENVDRALRKTKEAQQDSGKNTGLTKQLREIFSDVKWHSLEELSKILDIPVDDYQKGGTSSETGKEHPIHRSISYLCSKGEFKKEQKGNTWRTLTFRLVPKRISKTEPTIPVSELVAKLSPIIKFLDQQGRCHAATVSIPNIAFKASELRKLLDEWTSRHSAKGATLNASSSAAPKEEETCRLSS